MDFIKINNDIRPLRDVIQITQKRNTIYVRFVDEVITKVHCKNMKEVVELSREIAYAISVNNKIIDLTEIQELIRNRDNEDSLFGNSGYSS